MLPDRDIHQTWTSAPACAFRFIGVLFTDLVCIFQLLFVESYSPSYLLKLGEEKHLPGCYFFPCPPSHCWGKEVSAAVSLANSCPSSYRSVLKLAAEISTALDIFFQYSWAVWVSAVKRTRCAIFCLLLLLIRAVGSSNIKAWLRLGNQVRGFVSSLTDLSVPCCLKTRVLAFSFHPCEVLRFDHLPSSSPSSVQSAGPGSWFALKRKVKVTCGLTHTQKDFHWASSGLLATGPPAKPHGVGSWEGAGCCGGDHLPGQRLHLGLMYVDA